MCYEFSFYEFSFYEFKSEPDSDSSHRYVMNRLNVWFFVKKTFKF